MLKALAAPLNSKLPNGWHSSFTAWTTRVSNPVCSPRFRASASEPDQLAAFATGVLANIYEFHSTLAVPLTSSGLKPNSIEGHSVVKPQAFTPDLIGRLRALYAQ